MNDLTQGQCDRDGRNTRMAAHAGERVVEIDCMTGNAVNEGCVLGRYYIRMPPHGRRPRRVTWCHHLSRNRRARLTRTGKTCRKRVDQRVVHAALHVRRYVACFQDKPSKRRRQRFHINDPVS